ncbi:MAG TPA: Cof-type HAD-IIB family hydrolase [Chryseosolibacter sp.]
MKYRAICTDIDGTLLNKERQLSEKTIATVRSLGTHFPFILASSRMPSAMRHLQVELDIEHHPLIAYNGGYVLLYKDGKAIEFCSIEIPGAVVEKILSLSSGMTIHNSLYRRDEWFAPAADQWTEREEKITKVRAEIRNVYEVAAAWKARGDGAHKVMCMGPEEEVNVLEQRLTTNLAGEIHVYRSRPTYLELAPRSISKATGLALLLEKLYDFPMETVIGFGDNYNDIDMLMTCGLGIAVANARDEVLAVANEVTGKSVDDGVAAAIEKYCFPREK